MRQIALILSTSYIDDYTSIADTITDWDEVSNNDYQTLREYSLRKGYIILERIQKEEIPLLLAEHRELAKKEAEEVKKEKEKRDAAKALREMKKKEKEKALFEKLKKVYDDNSPNAEE